MPRWIERRGYTLQAPGEGDDERYVRLSLVERLGLIRGFFNVREARAESAETHAEIRLLGSGRMLSWRPLRDPEAERLLSERVSSLRAMGYTLIGTGSARRGRWDWLLELVQRRLRPGESPDEASPPDALRDALSRIGLSADDVVEGVASVLGVARDSLAQPDSRTARAVDAEQLGILLPFLLKHDSGEVRSIGERWLRCAPVPYQIRGDVLIRWLETDDRIASALAPRLKDEALALLGPDGVVRLAATGRGPAREAARAWAHRLG